MKYFATILLPVDPEQPFDGLDRVAPSVSTPVTFQSKAEPPASQAPNW